MDTATGKTWASVLAWSGGFMRFLRFRSATGCQCGGGIRPFDVVGQLCLGWILAGNCRIRSCNSAGAVGLLCSLDRQPGGLDQRSSCSRVCGDHHSGLRGRHGSKLQWAVTIIAGGSVAGVVNVGTSSVRATSTLTTAGLGNFGVATAELAISTMLSILLVAVPVLAALLVVVAIPLLTRMTVHRWDQLTSVSAIYLEPDPSVATCAMRRADG